MRQKRKIIPTNVKENNIIRFIILMRRVVRKEKSLGNIPQLLVRAHDQKSRRRRLRIYRMAVKLCFFVILLT